MNLAHCPSHKAHLVDRAVLLFAALRPLTSHLKPQAHGLNQRHRLGYRWLRVLVIVKDSRLFLVVHCVFQRSHLLVGVLDQHQVVPESD